MLSLLPLKNNPPYLCKIYDIIKKDPLCILGEFFYWLKHIFWRFWFEGALIYIFSKMWVGHILRIVREWGNFGRKCFTGNNRTEPNKNGTRQEQRQKKIFKKVEKRLKNC